MISEFRFLVICQGAMQRTDDHLVTLSGIVNEITTSASERTPLLAVVGLILRPAMKGKRLDLIAWSFGKTGEPEPLDGYVGAPLFLPDGLGPQTLPCEIALPIKRDGIYGFFLFDRDGVFGPKEDLLATYMFSATIVDS